MSSSPNSALTGLAAESRLRQYGLTADDLRDSVFAGYSAASTCTDHDPRSLPGTLAWGKSIGYLRDMLKPRGWKADRTSNYETVVHPSNALAIAVSAGTSQTGVASGVAPRTRTPKGPETSRAVKRNAQLPLGAGTTVFAHTGGREVEDKDRGTWILLHYFDPTEERVRLELSSPLSMEGKQITAWRERIILPHFDFATEVEIDYTDDPSGGDDVIEIDVPRRPE